MDPANIQLVAFLRDNLGSDEEPISKLSALKIVRQILHQNEGGLKWSLLQAKEVYAGKKSREEEFCDICFKTCRSKADRRRHEEGVHKKNEDVRY